MRQYDLNRVKFYSREDMAGGYQLSKGEPILRSKTKSNYSDINDVLELYNIKKYLDNELYLNSWTQEDIDNFKRKTIEYGNIIGRFVAGISDSSAIELYGKTLGGYVDSFWELVNNQKAFKRISKCTFSTLLSGDSHIIHEVLRHKGIVDYYDKEIKTFLLEYPKSAEILLSIYEQQESLRREIKSIPKGLTIEEKESIISNYLDSPDANLNYVALIQNARNGNELKISDKTRLKAKRLYESKIEDFFVENEGTGYGVAIGFQENADKIVDYYIDESTLTMHYLYNLGFIKQNNDPYSLFQNFKILFGFLDEQNRIELVSKKSQVGLFEEIMGIRSQNEYICGTAFQMSEMTSRGQIYGYSKILSDLNTSLENILYFAFTTAFQKKYNFAENAHFSIPSSTNSYLEKVRFLAPELESILKQYKLYIEDGIIDFELLQISSSPTSIKDIPSLNPNKYIYFNKGNKEMVGCSNLFFSDQTLLAYVDPFKEKQYHTFFNLLANEEVNFNNYEEHLKGGIIYLIDKGFIEIDSKGFIQITNYERLLIFKDLHDNEVASFYHYPLKFQIEAQRMAAENIIFFENSLFSRTEQAYFNYFLNKSEFTNGLDLRNSYLHGTQANPKETEKHKYAYFIYLKLLVLAMLKIEDDLLISKQ